jgi:sucrose PTS system EIIBCA or EIIBC component
MTNKDIARSIVELVGGEDNIASAAHCMTRVRLKIKDDSKLKLEDLRDVEGVMGVVESDTLQIVVGPGKAKKVYDEVVEGYKINASGDVENWEENKAALKGSQKETPVKQALKTISNIFIPLIPAVIAAGLFNGFASLLTQIPGFDVTAGFGFYVHQIFSLAGASFLGYFAVYTGINAAKEFGGTPALGGMIGGMTIGAQIVAISTALGLYNVDVPLNSVLTTGKGGIIGVIIGAWVMSQIERRIRKVVPDVLDLVITPFVTILLSGVLLVFVIMPLAGFASDALVSALSVIINSSNQFVRILSGYVLSAVFLPMVLLGLHHGLIPIYAIQLETMGGVSLFPVLAMAGAGQVGAAIAIYLKAKKVKNERMQKTILGALPAGFLGVGEPLIYGVTLPLGKPFITAGLGAGFGGAWVMLTGVMANAWGPSGLVALPLMQTPTMIANFFIGLVIAYIAGFIITMLFIKDDILR